MRRLMPAVLLAISVVGCATYRTPRGDDVATLRGAARDLGITSIDGEPTSSMIEFEGVGEVRLSPGKHSRNGSIAEASLTVTVQAGRRYVLKSAFKGYLATFWIEEIPPEAGPLV